MMKMRKKIRIKESKIKESRIKENKIEENKIKGSRFSAGKSVFFSVAVTLLCGLALNFGVSAAHRNTLQQGIAEEVLRFHVLANSDSERDQAVKYKVRDAVLEWLDAEPGFTGSGADAEIREVETGHEIGYETGAEIGYKAGVSRENEKALSGLDSGYDRQKEKNAKCDFLKTHLRQIAGIADQVLAEQGMPYHAEASVERCYFPERSYGSCTFPAGWYEALRIRLGEAQGQNWWCVLYPGLCFSDCLHAVLPDGSMARLRELLSAEEYESLLRQPKRWKISFRYLNFLN